MISRLQAERFGPIFLGTVAALGYWNFGGPLSTEIAKELLTALLSAAAISAGFMTTALSVLLPIGASPVGRRLKRKNKFELLFAYLRAAIYSCLALAVVCVVGLFLFDPELGLAKLPTSVVVVAAVYSTAAFIRILEILIEILPQIGEPEDKRG